MQSNFQVLVLAFFGKDAFRYSCYIKTKFTFPICMISNMASAASQRSVSGLYYSYPPFLISKRLATLSFWSFGSVIVLPRFFFFCETRFPFWKIFRSGCFLDELDPKECLCLYLRAVSTFGSIYD